MDTVESSARFPTAREPLDLAKRIEAVRSRTTRGLLTFNTGKVHRLEEDLWAVPSTRGGFHTVDLASEECDCEDRLFFGRDHGVACRHIYAAAIAAAKASARARFPRSRSNGRGGNGKGVRPEETLRGVAGDLAALNRLADKLGV